LTTIAVATAFSIALDQETYLAAVCFLQALSFPDFKRIYAHLIAINARLDDTSHPASSLSMSCAPGRILGRAISEKEQMSHEPITTRNEEALLAGAGYAPLQSDHCDFRLTRLDETRWQIDAISSRAEAWIRETLSFPLAQCFAGDIVVDVMSADRLLKEAHAKGLRTEFICRSGTDTF
jgi:hypothetical protein